MKTNSRKSTRAGILLPAVGALATCLLTFVLAEIPAWWNDRGLVKKDGAGAAVEASDFAAANQGQLKNVAIAAYEEFLAGIPAELGGIGADTPPVPGHPADQGSPGWRLRNLASQWVRIDRATGRVLRAVLAAQQHPTGTFSVNGTGPRQPAPGANAQKDFAAITQGQLKAVAAPFYARLAEVFWRYNSGTPLTSEIDPAWAKPWTDAPDDDNHHAMANLGQLKRVFSLDLHSDADSDGLPNLAELLANKLRSSSDPTKWTDLSNAYSTGGQLTDGEQVTLGLDPTDPASGAPPTAPAGLHITFRDATVHPDDPDLSLIKVEWNAPTQSNITISISDTYAGNPAGWGTAVPLGNGTTSRDFAVQFSKRIYQYRVTFKARNGLTSSTDIAYELPVIRGIMKRKNVTSFTFPGFQVRPPLPQTGIPAKFRTAKYEWDYYTESDGYLGVNTDHYYGNCNTTFDLGNGRGSSVTHIYQDGHYPLPDMTEMLLSDLESYTLAVEEPLAVSPTGSVGGPADYHKIDWNRTDGYSANRRHQYKLDLTLAPFLDPEGVGNPNLWKPYDSISGSYNLYDANNFGNAPGGPPDMDSDIGTINDEVVAGDQHPARIGVFKQKLGDAPETTAPYYHDDANNVASLLGLGWAGRQGDFSIGSALQPAFQENPTFPVPPAAGVLTTVAPTTWTRSWTDDSGTGVVETFSETATFSVPVTTDEMVTAAAETFADFDTLGIEWFRPYTTARQYRFTNSSLGFDFPKLQNFTEWNYTSSYTTAAPVGLVSAGYPVDGYVTVAPVISGLVGEYSLNAEETAGTLRKTEYKFRLYPPAESSVVSCAEVFIPVAVLAAPPSDPQRKTVSFSVSAGQTETPVQTVDRTQGWTTPATRGSHVQSANVADPSMFGALGAVSVDSRDAKPRILVDRSLRKKAEEISPPGTGTQPAPAGLVVRVNNLLDADGKALCTDTILTPEEKDEAIGTIPYDDAKRVEPINLSWIKAQLDQNEILRLRINSGAELIHVYDENGKYVLGRKASGNGDSEYYTVIAKPRERDNVTYWVEGIDAGEAILQLEVLDIESRQTGSISRQRIEVDLFRFPHSRGHLDDTDPALSARHRVGMLKQLVGGVRYVSGEISSLPPVLTWHRGDEKARTASLWVGFQTIEKSTDGKKPRCWLQAGLFKENKRGKFEREAFTSRFIEIVSNSDFSANDKVHNLALHEIEKELGKNSTWDMGRLESDKRLPAKFEVMVENAQGKAFYSNNGYRAVMTDGFKPPGFSFEREDFRLVEISYEASASVMRVPGTPHHRASVSEIMIAPSGNWKTRPEPNATPINCVANDFRISIFDAFNGVREPKLADAIGIEASFLHYHIRPLNGNSFEMWDTYEWFGKGIVVGRPKGFGKLEDW